MLVSYFGRNTIPKVDSYQILISQSSHLRSILGLKLRVLIMFILWNFLRGAFLGLGLELGQHATSLARAQEKSMLNFYNETKTHFANQEIGAEKAFVSSK